MLHFRFVGPPCIMFCEDNLKGNSSIFFSVPRRIYIQDALASRPMNEIVYGDLCVKGKLHNILFNAIQIPSILLLELFSPTFLSP